MIDVNGVSPVQAPVHKAVPLGAVVPLPGLWRVVGAPEAPADPGWVALCHELQIGPPEVLSQPSPPQLLEALHHAPQALVVLDAAWASQQEEALLRVLRRHAAGRVLLSWTEPHGQWLDLVVRCDARGAIERHHMPPDLQVQALRSLRAGRMWFPRAFMQALYEALSRRLDIDHLSAEALAWAHAAAHAGDGSTDPLTPRERQVFQLMRSGQSNKQIAAQLAISVNTVKKHLASAFSKTGLRHRRQVLT